MGDEASGYRPLVVSKYYWVYRSTSCRIIFWYLVRCWAAWCL